MKQGPTADGSNWAASRCNNTSGSRLLRRNETGKFKCLAVEGRRGAAAQSAIAGFDQTIGKIGGRVLSGIEGVFNRSLVLDAAIADSLEQAKLFWRLREMFGEVQRHEGGSIKHDVSVPVAAVPDFIAEANAAVAALLPEARPVPFGHLGDGNIHYNVSQPVGADRAEFLARWNEVNAAVFAVVKKFGGSISAEHGVGVMKRDLLPSVKDPVALDLMRKIKHLLDPNNILNPGKVL